MEAIDPFVFRLSIFVLAIFVGYFVVWSVTPALHTPLMSVTNAISSVIVVGALIAVSVSTLPPKPVMSYFKDAAGNTEVYADNTKIDTLAPGAPRPTMYLVPIKPLDPAIFKSSWTSKGLGFVALILACVNIFGGFLVTSRMLAMYKKKEK